MLQINFTFNTIYADDTTLIAPICSFAIENKNDYKEIGNNVSIE